MVKKFIVIGILAFAFLAPAVVTALDFSSGHSVAQATQQYVIKVTGTNIKTGVDRSKNYTVRAVNNAEARREAIARFNAEFKGYHRVGGETISVK